MAQGGKPFYDRQKAGEVRTKTLECIELILDDDEQIVKWSKHKLDIIHKLATNILPRLNEVTGIDGKDLFPDEESIKKSKEAIKEVLKQ